ncbi:unnamed protein product [Arabis nemorensis]|uniref:Rab3 GTPase-activating protein catalytic subunit n=1 Tax=Arabis nemorensis TaxID=586526 RepID=A0A565CRS3_9BRAS|nr:unnamed protein product [Arabis nemorensis]
MASTSRLEEDDDGKKRNTTRSTREQLNPLKQICRGNVTGELSNSIAEDTSNRLRFERITEHTNSVNQSPTDAIRRGSAGPVGTMMLLKSRQRLHAPFTQGPPLMTEDMHEERLQAVEAFGDSLGKIEAYSFVNLSSIHHLLLVSILFPDLTKVIADMSAFEAANPDAVFEDFIRWHSPGPITEGLKDKWPPRGHLSQWMSDQGNLWRKSWNDAPALPADDQKPLLDPNREGEKILHYLETVWPHQLLEQMVCTAFIGSADTLNQTNFGDMKQMTSKLEQLYLIIKSTLGALQLCKMVMEEYGRHNDPHASSQCICNGKVTALATELISS